ncbi:DUF3089 domain-containing protein [Leptospira sp. 96542]|nr:DUF3089 domain-containing protein [Leptospira sp. 96542]
MKIHTMFLIFIINVIFSNCTTLFIYWIKPGHNFSESKLPDPPNYSDKKYWASHPELTDEADLVPENSNLTDNQKNAKADVFFVHPSTYLSDKGWNADTQASLIVYGLSPIKLQTTVFNGSAKIYAPKYRQATLYSFIDDSGNAEKAFLVAERDVENAFLYYMKHENKGRPFFLAGHSQGSMMLINVLKKHIDTKKYPNFVAAYLPGWAIKTSDFAHIKPCNSPKETNCYVSWNSKKWGSQLLDFSLPPERYVGGSCVNPVSWKYNEETIEKEKHKGAIGINFQGTKTQYVKTKCQGEMLWVDLPSDPNFESRRGNKKNYHTADYNLFYMDIRENISIRLEQHLNRK